jgi:hypothetical protein
MAYSQSQINIVLANIQTLHARFANELCNILKRHTGEQGMYYELVSMNNVVGKIKDILYDYEPVGNTTLNDLNNNLTEEEMTSLITYCYKVLNKYNSNVFIPTNPNVFL